MSLTLERPRSISVTTKSPALILNWQLKRAANRRVVFKSTFAKLCYFGVDLEKCSPKRAVAVESSRATQLRKVFEKAAKRRKIGPKPQRREPVPVPLEVKMKITNQQTFILACQNIIPPPPPPPVLKIKISVVRSP